MFTVWVNECFMCDCACVCMRACVRVCGGHHLRSVKILGEEGGKEDVHLAIVNILFVCHPPTCTHTHTHACTHPHPYTHTRARARVRTHARTHTRTHAHSIHW